MNDTKTTEISQWKLLFKLGGIAPFITMAFYLIQLATIIFSGKSYPATPDDWFTLFHRNPILGLIFLNALDILSIAILGLMFLAICILLWQTNPSLLAVAAFFACLGISVFVSTRSNMVAATLTLSNQYNAAPTNTEINQILGAGQAIMALGRATPETIGFFFIAIASLIISILMLKSDIFSSMIGYLGILGFTITSANHISVLIAPSLAAMLMPISGLIWLIWWIWAGTRLLQLETTS